MTGDPDQTAVARQSGLCDIDRMLGKRLAIIATLLFGLAAGSVYATTGGDYPPLRDGDLVFQTSKSSQSGAIFVATANAFTHMGIIKNNEGKISVIEAGSTVREIPLKAWVNRGVMARVAIYRDPALTPEQAKRVLSAARALYGRAYDIFFSFNNDAIYCSELPYLAYKAAGISIGKLQKISELHFDNVLVRNLIRQRWQRHAECTSRGYNFDQCFSYILNQDLVTPASIAADPRFKLVYSNYPF
jgi:hypothetical protein